MAVLDTPFRQSKIPRFVRWGQKKVGKRLIEKKYILRLLNILKRYFLAWQRVKTVNNTQREGFCCKNWFQCSPCWTTVSHISKNFRKLLETMENKSLFYVQVVLGRTGQSLAISCSEHYILYFSAVNVTLERSTHKWIRAFILQLGYFYPHKCHWGLVNFTIILVL